jgi:hypothetical protein
MRIEYQCHTIQKGELLSQSLVSVQPNMYGISRLLIMYDPDAPSGTFLHWIIQNGKIQMPYFPPKPPSGVHHYIINLYEREMPYQPTGRVVSPEWIKSLGAPIETFMFMVGENKGGKRTTKLKKRKPRLKIKTNKYFCKIIKQLC